MFKFTLLYVLCVWETNFLGLHLHLQHEIETKALHSMFIIAG